MLLSPATRLGAYRFQYEIILTLCNPGFHRIGGVCVYLVVKGSHRIPWKTSHGGTHDSTSSMGGDSFAKCPVRGNCRGCKEPVKDSIMKENHPLPNVKPPITGSDFNFNTKLYHRGSNSAAAVINICVLVCENV